ncbi:MFS transporter [Qipengyuania sp. 6B39]|uniref:MFS transporter n=1 Tax=Qipengyuania proteolytica TaxID=2867239 RepID=UPI001C895C7E|nr:MFS transporter [Qipengyuania proteolytica]MBX7495056.1 MFS transporter [Qipengyuania proteolytica]
MATAAPRDTIAPPPAEQLPTRLKLFHGFGSIAYGVKENGFATFLLLFYNQVVGIDAGLVGAAIMVALIADAFVDPVIGELTDRTNTRWGRRLPWLYAAPIPLALAWMMLWSPPEGSTAFVLTWLIGWAIVVRSLVSMCEVPSVALVPELTSDYDERTVLMRYRFLFGWAGGLLMLILAYGVFFREAGETDPRGYGPYAIACATLMAVAVLVSAMGQHKRVAHPSPPQPRQAGGLREVAREMRKTLSNRAFLWLVFAALFAFTNQGIAFSLTNYFLGFLWQFTQLEKVLYGLLLFATMLTAFVIIPPLAKRLGKREAAMVAGATSLAFNASLFLLYYFDLFPGLPDKPSVVAMFAMTFFVNTGAIVLMVLSSSMMADVVEASQAETGRRSEGLFFAGYFFMQKCATGAGIFLAGQIISWAAFPIGSAPGEVSRGIIANLALGYVIALVAVGVTGLFVLRRFPIDRASHEQRLAILSGAARMDPDAEGMHP